MNNKKSVKDFDYKGKTVIVRCDFNVPMDENGNITDDRRIVSSLATINYLLDNNAKVILLSHLGRPKGEANEKYSLGRVASKLSELLNKKVYFLADDRVVNADIKNKVKELDFGEVVLLENTRYRKEEEENDQEFAKELSALGDIFINDAFGTSHRAHASNVGIASNLPSGLGFLVEKEMDFIGKSLESPERPFLAILGGAKVSDKIGVIENLITIVDKIIVGGGMAYTFLKAQGYEIGNSLLEEDKLELAKELLNKAKENKVEILLPVDVVVAKEFKNDTEFKTVNIDSIPDDMMGLDIGEKTIDLFTKAILSAKTVVWNGPVGVFEMDNFAKGTNSIAKAMAETKGITIIGGGDSAAAIEKAGFAKEVSHISTGGGASLELLEGKKLPGIISISDK